MKIKLSRNQWEKIGQDQGWKVETPGKRIFHEFGVDYSFSQTDPTQKKFNYTLIHIPTENFFKESVWCWSEKDFYKLMTHWNRQKEWKTTI